MAKLILILAYWLGIPTLFRYWHRNRLTILLYHGVRSKQDTHSTDLRGKHIPASIFEKHIHYLKKHYHLLSWSEAFSYLQNKQPFPPHSLCITFDDGYANQAHVAAPILNRYNIKTIFYVTTGFLDGEPLWTDRFERALTAIREPIFEVIIRGQKKSYAFGAQKNLEETDDKLKRVLKTLTAEERKPILMELERLAGPLSPAPLLEPMSWDDARQLTHDGHEIGAHTVTHPILSRESDETCREELQKSKEVIEKRLKVPCLHFAYPNGNAADFHQTTIALVREAGYTSAVTTIPGTVGMMDDPLRLRRLAIDYCFDQAMFVCTITGVRYWLSNVKQSFFL
ncbi:MAG: polysaccharide deacetylase family protein [Candidatus Uhrbacteria bacterium]|nr:polysaccharide deacetylase family protein [Candidatus Uhrbacteria bacterium]